MPFRLNPRIKTIDQHILNSTNKVLSYKKNCKKDVDEIYEEYNADLHDIMYKIFDLYKDYEFPSSKIEEEDESSPSFDTEVLGLEERLQSNTNKALKHIKAIRSQQRSSYFKTYNLSLSNFEEKISNFLFKKK
ncbi:hypothetical protein AYI70_g8044 [Smittium culicis]|uniref:Uncharacterized protein n=1 Tax=Smittium culicis TaxID=133412 RepID=A0A1R1XHU4_9FUNG|nr:hypothetical protein AYI70_g8044 [Smittium culicis]